MLYRVRFLPEDRMVEMPRGTYLLDAVKQAGLPIARGCSGQGLCARCGVRILSGGDVLASEKPVEIEAKRANRVEAGLRLSCCTCVDGDLEVTASYW
jgi:2Fe-2S ferredoxin